MVISVKEVRHTEALDILSILCGVVQSCIEVEWQTPRSLRQNSVFL